MGIRLDHIGIATEQWKHASKFWKIFGLIQGD